MFEATSLEQLARTKAAMGDLVGALEAAEVALSQVGSIGFIIAAQRIERLQQATISQRAAR
ncbi:MAG TPA: hypothetical protein VG815_05445 [Chloroflexota bacterium]|jgi:hypothetical protein|nr:hypothetical protein [Chloroflexota bacterium]